MAVDIFRLNTSPATIHQSAVEETLPAGHVALTSGRLLFVTAADSEVHELTAQSPSSLMYGMGDKSYDSLQTESNISFERYVTPQRAAKGVL